MLDDNCLDGSEKPYTKWVASNIIVKDGHLVDDIKRGAREAEINVDSVMEEFRISSSEPRKRQLHYDDQAFDVESSHKSGSSSNEGDEAINDNDGSGGDDENDKNQDSDSGLSLNSITGEEYFTHATQNKYHGS